MSTTPAPAPPTETIPLGDVEHELARLMTGAKEPGEATVRRARMSNLVIFCTNPAHADSLALAVPNIVAVHPARVLMVVGEPGPDRQPVTASIHIWSQLHGAKQRVCSEQVTLRAKGEEVDNLPYAVRSLLIGD